MKRQLQLTLPGGHLEKRTAPELCIGSNLNSHHLAPLQLFLDQLRCNPTLRALPYRRVKLLCIIVIEGSPIPQPPQHLLLFLLSRVKNIEFLFMLSGRGYRAYSFFSAACVTKQPSECRGISVEVKPGVKKAVLAKWTVVNLNTRNLTTSTQRIPFPLELLFEFLSGNVNYWRCCSTLAIVFRGRAELQFCIWQHIHFVTRTKTKLHI